MNFRSMTLVALLGLTLGGCATPRAHVQVTLDLRLCDLMTGHWYGRHGHRYDGHCQGEAEADFMLGCIKGQRARSEQQLTLRQRQRQDNYTYSLDQMQKRRERLLKEGGNVAELADIDSTIERLERRQRQASVTLQVRHANARVAMQ